MDQESPEYQQWKVKHEGRCEINHKGSSGEMEAVAAVEMFGRSLCHRKLKYVTFVGDGDSSSYGKVKEAMEEKYVKPILSPKKNVLAMCKRDLVLH